MWSVGGAYDNALCESFSATVECELIERRKLRNQAEAKIAVFDFLRRGAILAGATQPLTTSPR